MRRHTLIRLGLLLVLLPGLAFPAAVVADYGPNPPCPMTAGGAAPDAPAPDPPCTIPCDRGAAGTNPCDPCHFCKIGSVFHAPADLHAKNLPPAAAAASVSPATIAESPPTRFWHPPRTC